MATGEFKHLNRDERHQFYLATGLGAAVHRATSDGGDGSALYNITRAVDAAPIATGVSFESLMAFTSGQPMAPAATNPLDDLTTVVAALRAGFEQLDRAIQAQVAALTGALNGSGVPSSTLRPMQQRAANISFISSSMARDARAVMA
jgi:hypothetical protein